MQEIGLTSAKPLEFIRTGHKSQVFEKLKLQVTDGGLVDICKESICIMGMNVPTSLDRRSAGPSGDAADLHRYLKYQRLMEHFNFCLADRH